MLTVKHIEPTGHETIYETQSVAAEPVGPNSDNLARVYYQAAGGCGSINTGRVYVMNEAGQTIATYYLGGWDKPASDAA